MRYKPAPKTLRKKQKATIHIKSSRTSKPEIRKARSHLSVVRNIN